MCNNTSIEEVQEFSPEQFLLKIRTSLNNILKLQIRIYKNLLHIDYSYQVYDTKPIMRWDNAEHFSEILTYPHHFHNKEGEVLESPLTGNPAKDIYIVLNLIQDLL